MVAASHCSCFSQCVGRGQGSAAGAAEDHMKWMSDALKCMGLLVRFWEACFDKVFASSFWEGWWQVSLYCCHPLEYDVGVVLYVVCHFVHAVGHLDWILDVFPFISEWHFNMVAASHCSCCSQCVGRGQGSAAGAAEDHMTCMLDALKCMGLST